MTLLRDQVYHQRTPNFTAPNSLAQLLNSSIHQLLNWSIRQLVSWSVGMLALLRIVMSVQASVQLASNSIGQLDSRVFFEIATDTDNQPLDNLCLPH